MVIPGSKPYKDTFIYFLLSSLQCYKTLFQHFHTQHRLLSAAHIIVILRCGKWMLRLEKKQENL